jgi:hypothetical protein
MRSSTLCLIVGCAVAAIVLAASIAVADNDEDLKLIADTTNVFGAAITFLGLLYAYVCASSYATEWLQIQRARMNRVWAKITGRPLPGPRGQATTAIAVDTIAGGAVGVRLDASLQELAGFVNGLSIAISNLQVEIHKVRAAIQQATADARAGDAQTLVKVEDVLRQLDLRLKWAQVLDLRFAMAGVALSSVGAVLNWCI